jgi:hypothetical protein
LHTIVQNYYWKPLKNKEESSEYFLEVIDAEKVNILQENA